MYKKLFSVTEGQHKIISDYYNRNDFLKFARQALYEAISEIAGESVTEKVKVYGLDKIHLYFNPDYVPFLQFALKKRMNKFLSKQIFNVGKNNLYLGKKNSFYIDQTMNYRIIYPFEVAKKSQLTRSIYLSLNLENYKNADKEIINARIKAKNYSMTKSDINKIKYFRNLPGPSWGHGPHRDTWFGHTFGALNLWWSITGVNHENGLVLYPKVTDIEIKHIKEPAYLAPNQYLNSPKIIALKDGDLLVFDPEILHAARLNTSNQTRIVFSGRINKNKPKFYKRTKADEFPHWFSSKDFTSNIFNKTHFFYKKDNSTIMPKKRKLNGKNYFEIKIKKKFSRNSKFKLINNKNMSNNKLYKIVFNNMDLCMVIFNNFPKVFFSKCPHLGINLSDGFLDKKKIICPGHALSFDLNNGKSECQKLKLKFYKIKKEKNHFFLYT